MSRPAERGAALVAVTAALAALVVVALGVLAGTLRAERRTRAALATLQADALARSAAATAAALLADWTALDQPDDVHAPWAQPIAPQELGGGRVEVIVEDEARRLDLGTAEPDALPRLLEALALDRALADAIADWTDPDDRPRPYGAERAAYRDGTPPPNAPLRSVGELGLVRGVDARTLARLRPFVTVAGEAGVNPNTAPREVLLAWLGDAARADEILARRATVPIACDDLPRCTTRARNFALAITVRVGSVRRRVDATVWAAAGRADVVAWRLVPPPA
ncbi:MAG: general secretion pathway protein GspK [bacterium]|nr:general secretion pathway protein GspK [bacterium]